MILADHEIKKLIQEGVIKIDPPPDFETQLGPCSLDLRLGNSIKIFKNHPYPYIDIKQVKNFEDLMIEIKIGDNGSFVLPRRGFVLAITKESFILPKNLMARLDGRSSLGRLGIVVHSTAARFDPGWTGQAVLELGNLSPSPVVLYEGMKICSLTFEKLSSDVEFPYGSKKIHKYRDQSILTSPLSTKISEEFK